MDGNTDINASRCFRISLVFCSPNVEAALPSTEPELDFLSSAGSDFALVIAAGWDVRGGAGVVFGVGVAGSEFALVIAAG